MILVTIVILASFCIYSSFSSTRKPYHFLLICLIFLLGSEALKAVPVFELSADFLSTKNFLELGQANISYKLYLSILPLVSVYVHEKSNLLVTIWLLVPLSQILFISNALSRQKSVRLFVFPKILGIIISIFYANLAILFISSGFFLSLPVFNPGAIVTGHLLFQSVSVSVILIGGLFYWFGNKVAAYSCLILAIVFHPSSILYLLICLCRPPKGLKVLPFNFTITKTSFLKLFALVISLSIVYFNTSILIGLYYASSVNSSYSFGVDNIRFVYNYCLPLALLIFLLENILTVKVESNSKTPNSPLSISNSQDKSSRGFFQLASFVTYTFFVLVFLSILLDFVNPGLAFRLAALPCFVLLVPAMYIVTLYSVQLFFQYYRRSF